MYKCYNVIYDNSEWDKTFLCEEGIDINKYKLQNGVEIDAVLVGEKGIGRRLGILPVQLLENWVPDVDPVYGVVNNPVKIKYVSLGKTRAGFPKLIETNEKTDIEGLIVLIDPPLYYRGGGNYNWNNEPEILIYGTCAQGGAGRMGSINCYVYKIIAPCECHLHLDGRSYGEPTDYVISVNSRWEISCLPLEENSLL